MNRHKKEDGWVRSRALVALVGLLVMTFIALLVAQDFRINDVRIDPDGKIRLRHQADTNHYYILYRGTVITNIVLATDLALGTNTVGEFVDGAVPPGGAAFYRVRQVPVNQPLDSDGDGIDDVFELRHRNFLNPLDSADAQRDFDNDGRSNLDEYRRGTDPAIANTAPIVTLASPVDNGNYPASTIPLAVAATDPDGSVVMVEYFAGTNRIGQTITAPFGLTWSNVTAGEYVVTARATDNFGASTVSSPVRILVNLPPPVVTPPSTSTRNSAIELSGISLDGSQIIVAGGASTVTTSPGPGGNFTITVPLQTNRLNRLFLSSADGSGHLSGQITLEIIQDSQPPSLFIDFPADNSELTSSNIVVAGRVGDMLSGFMGLAVTVNGQSANVVVGIGNNGTFERGGIPLVLGTNTITAVASDILGNSITNQISVTRVPLSGPSMAVVSGDGQITHVHARLPNPVVVRVTNPNGSAFQNKIVTFNVIRSDGRLVSDPSSTDPPSMMLQVFTDANGEARAWWILGGDAGCGNNRIAVTSKDIAGSTFFCASATPAPARQINIGSGNNQHGEAGGSAPEALRAWVNDSCNGVENVPVTFTVTRGGGKVNGANSVTIPTTRTGHAQVNFTFGPEAGNNTIEANYPGHPGLPATFNCSGVTRDLAKPTTLSGVVLDNSSQPIGHALCEIFLPDAPSPVLLTYSDPQGRFIFTDPPAGPVHLFVYGASATTVGTNNIPPNSFPFLTYFITLTPNADNTLPRPVLLPRLNPINAHTYYGTNDLVLTCEGIAGLKMTIKAGSMRDARGLLVTSQNPAQVSLNQVHHNDVPMAIPDGASPAFAWTLQPGRSTFNPPVQIEYPNMTGLPAGTVGYFLSFNHDTERFEIVASGHVTDDGSTMVTDPGAGLSVAGWGGNCPPYSVTGDVDKMCGLPMGSALRAFNPQGNPPVVNCAGMCDGTIGCDDGDPCTVNDRCQNGVCKGDPIQVQSITVVSGGATRHNVTGTDNWAAVKDAGVVVVEITISPNSDEAVSRITWSGGSPVPGNPRQRKVSKATSVKTTVKASCGASSKELNVWILWATVTIQMAGRTPANAVQYGSLYDGTERLGAISYFGPLGQPVAVGKVVPIAQLTPPGVEDVVKAGWEFKRYRWFHSFDDARVAVITDSDWTDDTSRAVYQNLVPDVDDRIYDRDAPNITAGTATMCAEVYANFRQHVEWNGEVTSDAASWSWNAKWQAGATPEEIIWKVLSTSEISLPAAARGCP